MKVFRHQLSRVVSLRRKGAVNLAIASAMVALTVAGSLSLEYLSGRTFDLLYNTWQGMTLESYRNLVLVTAILGWLVSQSSSSQSTTHRRPFRP